MARRKTRTLTTLELEIMHVIWRNGRTSVEAIRQALAKTSKPLALPSIRTMLGILQEKGYVTRTRKGRAYLYRPVVSAEKAKKRILDDVIERAFDGSAWSLVAALVDSRTVSAKELEKIRELIDQRKGRDK